MSEEKRCKYSFSLAVFDPEDGSEAKITYENSSPVVVKTAMLELLKRIDERVRLNAAVDMMKVIQECLSCLSRGSLFRTRSFK